MSDNKEQAISLNFEEMYKLLSSGSLIRTKEGKINMLGTTISGKDFDKLYLSSISQMLASFEQTITPDFSPTKSLYSTLDVLSTPVLKSTSVPETIKKFYGKMNIAMAKEPSKKEIFESTLTDYVQEASNPPVFMLVSMSEELPAQDKSTNIYEKLMPSSTQLMDDYGIRYNGDDILTLANQGFIKPEEPINMLIFNSLEAQDENSADYLKPVEPKALLDFYSPEQNPNRIHSLLEQKKISEQFKDLHQKLLEKNEVSDRKDYFDSLLAERKSQAKSAEQFSSDALNYAEATIIPFSSLVNVVSVDTIKKKFISHDIGIATILTLYETDPKYFSQLELLLTPSEITNAHSKLQVSDNALTHVPQGKTIQYLKDKNTPFETMVYLFLNKDEFSFSDFKALLSEHKFIDSLEPYIGMGTSPAKIKELYEGFLIDYTCLKHLQKAGILTENAIRKYKINISAMDTYSEISETQNISINGTNGIVTPTPTGTFIFEDLLTSKKQDSHLEPLYTVLNGKTNPTPLSEFPKIEHHTDNEKSKGFLDGYTVIPLKAAKLVLLMQKNPIQQTYIMPYQEFAFIMHSKTLPIDFAENESIKVVQHSEKNHENILQTVAQFEESQNYLNAIGYNEDSTYEQNMIIMLENYQKVRIKGEN